VKPLRVIYRGSVNSFKNYDKSAREIAKEINVDFLVEASVMKINDSIMLQLRLIKALPDEEIVWAETFTSDMANILRLHSSIAEQISHNMHSETLMRHLNGWIMSLTMLLWPG